MKEIIQAAFSPNAVVELEACDSAGSIGQFFKDTLPDAHVYGFTGSAFSLWHLFDEYFPWFDSDWVEIKGCK